MSITNFLKSLSVIILGGLLGYNLIKLVTPEVQKNRGLASMPIAKMGSEQMARSFFELQLDTNDIAKTESDTSLITVKFTALKEIQLGLEGVWNLPSDVHVIEGNLQDQVGALHTGESKYFKLKINGFSKELKKYISFEVKGVQNQWPLRSEVLVSSRIEDSLEFLIQQGEKKRQKTTFNKLSDGKTKSKFSVENVVR